MTMMPKLEALNSMIMNDTKTCIKKSVNDKLWYQWYGSMVNLKTIMKSCRVIVK